MARAGGKPDNVHAIGAALDAPIDAPQLGAPDPHAPDDGDDAEDIKFVPPLPKASPVRALGMKGQACYYLDAQGQLIALNPRDHGKNNIIALFSPKTHLPMKYWPRWSEPKYEGRGAERTLVKPSEIVGFAQDLASEALIGACGTAGIFDPLGKVRSRGAHLGRDNALVVHCGDKILVTERGVDGRARAGQWFNPGEIGKHVYPAAAPSPRPADGPVDVSVGEGLYATLQTWNWKRPLLDPMLLLGWAGQAFICGAPAWRTHVFVTGGAGTGKSTLNGKGMFFDRLLGKGLLRTGSATEAAVRQLLGAQTIPVIFDEFEPSEFNAHKTKAMLELARVASSGDDMHKGGQDHQAQQFVLQSAFQFSAILMPVMQPQDRSRFAVLELKPFARHVPDPAGKGNDADIPTSGIDLDALKLPELGQKLMRRMLDGWPRYAETLRLYRRALERVGHSARGQDTFGALLTCADLLLYDHLPDQEMEDGRTTADHWARACKPDTLAELLNTVDEHDACITHLSYSPVQPRGGDERTTVSALIERAVINAKRIARGDVVEVDPAARHLEHIGLKLVNMRPTPAGNIGTVAYKPGDRGYLAVCSEHGALGALFRDSRWHSGAWSQALSRVKVEYLVDGNPMLDEAVTSVAVKFDGRMMRATLVPLEAVIDPEDCQS